MRNTFGWSYVPWLFCLSLLAAAGCTKNSGSSSWGTSQLGSNPGSNPAGTTAPNASTPTSAAVVSAQIQSINTTLNASPQYALSASDIQTLNANGLLQGNDQSALNQFAQ